MDKLKTCIKKLEDAIKRSKKLEEKCKNNEDFKMAIYYNGKQEGLELAMNTLKTQMGNEE